MSHIILACPCHADCPVGCVECESWACNDQCDNPDDSSSILEVFLAFSSRIELQLNIKCQADADMTLAVCFEHCEDDVACGTTCLNDFEENLEFCPCGSHCPGNSSLYSVF